jgi:hypothetical protein
MLVAIPLFPQKNKGAQGATGATGPAGGGGGGGGSQGATGATGATGSSYWQINTPAPGPTAYLSPNPITNIVCIGATTISGDTGIFRVNGHAYITGTCIAKKFNASSDYRIKENIKLLDLTEYNVDNLKPIIYNHKTDNETNIGFLAHEVQEYFPFLVLGSKDGEKTQSINYTGLIGVLTKEIQELKKDNKKIKEKLITLETKLNEL